MLFDQAAAKESLVRMVRFMSADPYTREDLLQEALIHLWLTESRRPGQTRSWYQQSCRFHLQHYLSSGRSLDSYKRRRGRLCEHEPEADSPGWEFIADPSTSGDSILSSVCARDMLSILSSRLLARERQVLLCCAEGMSSREIGRKLSISHAMVIKHRRKIATLFARLERPREAAVANAFNYQ